VFITNENLYKQGNIGKSMINKEVLRNIVKLQRGELAQFDNGIQREEHAEIDLNVPFAIILSGIRRCGKSTLLRQIIKKLKSYYYFNFEDSRAVDFDVKDFEKLEEVFHEEYGNGDYYFFDEIQNIPKWEVYVRRLVDLKKHVIITGSNASLLSKELGTRLTGRHLTHEMFPFSFKEFLTIEKKEASIHSFENYLTEGGLPEYLQYKRPDILQILLNDILNRDIAARHKIRSQRQLKELATYLLTNVGKQFTYNSLKKNFKFGSVNSVISFMSHFEDAYLIFTIPKFDFSYKKMLVSPKKVYSIDNGMTIRNSASFFDDRGRLLENLVFLSLRRKHKEILYFQNENECDFIVKDGAKIVQAVQSCYELNEDNKERELNGISEAVKKFKLKEGLILTYNQTDDFDIRGIKVKVMPVWKWLLSH
jgi:predicted AAA+ superfamily ATPase